MRDKKLYSIKEFCKRRGYEPYQYFTELKRHPKQAVYLTQDKNGEYLIDRNGLLIVDDVFQCLKYKRKAKAAKRQNTEAVAAEINSLTIKNEKMKERLKVLAAENAQLRKMLNCGKTKKSKTEE